MRRKRKRRRPSLLELLVALLLWLRPAAQSEASGAINQQQVVDLHRSLDFAKLNHSGSQRLVQVEAGQTASLACHLDQAAHANEHLRDDLVSLVFWYRDENPAPIYTLDARPAHVSWQAAAKLEREPDSKLIGWRNQQHLLARARHHRAGEMAQRLTLDTGSSFPLIKLLIERARAQDSGSYKCRLDFKRSATIYQQTSLQVRVAPSSVELVPVSSKWIQTTSDLSLELNEDELVEFVCSVREGWPPPKLGWFLIQADGQTKQLTETSRPEGKTFDALAAVSKLVLGPINREQHSEAQIGCKLLEAHREEDDARDRSHDDEVADERFNGQSPGKMIDELLTSRRPAHAAKSEASQSGQTGAGKVRGSGSITTSTTTSSKWLRLQLNLKPTRIEISSRSKQHQVSRLVGGASTAPLFQLQLAAESQTSSSLQCRVFGSRPAANISWQWRAAPNESSSPPPSLEVANSGADSDSSWSSVEVAELTWRHHQAELLCEATNEATKQRLVATIRLNIQFKPIVWLSTANDHDRDERPLIEGANPDRRWSTSSSLLAPSTSKADQLSSKLRCQAKSNPAINQLVWLRDGQPLAKIIAQPEEARWRFLPLLESSLFQARYRLDNWNELSLFQAAEADQTSHSGANQSHFQCVVANDLGQTRSAELALRSPHLPRCLEETDHSEKDDRLETHRHQLAQMLGLRIHRITVVSKPEAAFTCPAESEPAADQFAWSLASLDDIASAHLDRANLSQVSRAGPSRLTLLELRSMFPAFGQTKPAPSGLLSCRATNQLGLGESCINLVLAGDQLDNDKRPSASNCTIELASSETLGDEPQLEVDCSRVEGGQLLFQLSVWRLDSSQTGAKQYLFSTGKASSRLRVPLHEIEDIISTGSTKLSASAGKLTERRPDSAKVNRSLEAQMGSLKELVFTLRASNLVSLSEPNAIYGSQVPLASLLDRPARAGLSLNEHRPALEGQPEESMTQMNRARSPLSNTKKVNLSTTLVEQSPYRFEVSVSIAAICAVVVLSGLTLSLIFLLLRDRSITKAKTKSGRESEQKVPTQNAIKLSKMVTQQTKQQSPTTVQLATTCDMLARPATRNLFGPTSYTRTSLSSPCEISPKEWHYDGSLLATNIGSGCPQVTVKLNQDRPIGKDTLYLVESMTPLVVASPTTLARQSDSCDTHSVNTSNSAECDNFASLLINRSNAEYFLPNNNCCSSSVHNSSSFCEEPSISATLTNSDFAIVPDTNSAFNVVAQIVEGQDINLVEDNFCVHKLFNRHSIGSTNSHFMSKQ